MKEFYQSPETKLSKIARRTHMSGHEASIPRPVRLGRAYEE
jgi:hypothetical protein